MKATAIVGAMYGDESKGKHVDYHSAKYGDKALVVRFNGGAQAGHTVVTPEGERHVFKHFGSGTFNGSPTYLSPDFIINPILFREECETLLSMGIVPRVYVDEMCLVTIPYDMMINQILESHRESSTGRHGSCGAGIYETITRSRHTKSSFVLYASDLRTPKFIKDTIINICHSYIPVRLAQLGIKNLPTEWVVRFMDSNIITRFVEDVEFMYSYINIVKSIHRDFGKKFDHVIFEGAQGLMLDQHNWNFPHVTPSNTGLTNVVPLISKFGIENLDVVYLTRAYTTRHGAGKLPYELPTKPYPNIVDKTNIPNEWQGSLRFSFLNLDDLNRTIYHDMEANNLRIPVSYGLGLSCLDQLDDMFYFHKSGCFYGDPSDNAVDIVNDNCEVRLTHISNGPTRNDIKEI